MTKLLDGTNHQLWDSEPLFSFLQRSGVFNDQKTLVDMPLKTPLPLLEKKIAVFLMEHKGDVIIETVQSFVDEHFEEAGTDLLPHVPEDYNITPEDFLPRIKHIKLRKWSLEIHSLWLQLSRLVPPSMKTVKELHSLLPVPNPVMIPGSRFREVYYWDSYWIVRGLLVSKMPKTAKGVVENLLWAAQENGFVPNGMRQYYLNRSQPPLLSQMVRLIHQETADLALVEASLPVLIAEHRFWTSGTHNIKILDNNGKIHELSRFFANWKKPRPESYRQDSDAAVGCSATESESLFQEIASAAESGWDFSSRWMGDGKTMQSMRVTSIIPVDLNAFLFQMENNIRYFASLLGQKETEDEFLSFAILRKAAMDSLLWNEAKGQWFDFWLPLQPEGSETHSDFVFHGGSQHEAAFASNFVPLWCGILETGDKRAIQVVDALEASGLLQPAGIAASVSNTGEQWDFPNAWAPLQDMIVEGLEQTGLERAEKLACEIATGFLSGAWTAYEATGYMHEKYSAQIPGCVGGGGEYAPQVKN